MPHNKIEPNAYQSAPYKAWIRHTDGSTNVLIVFKWFKESKRLYMFAKHKGVVENYRINTIAEVRYYDNQDKTKTQHVGGRDKDGVYYGEMEFMNQLKALK
jgi:hypothetical protein